MCLEVNTQYKIAKEDIVCYKILEKDYDGNLFSPYTFFRWDLNKRTKADGKPTFTTDFKGTKYIAIGYFHTFKNIVDAKKYSKLWPPLNHPIICECTIPKGTKYWEGLYDGYKGFASKNLIIESKLD